MSPLRTSSILSTLLCVSGVVGHSRILNIVIDGVQYEGYDPKIPDNPDVLVAWSTTADDDGWVNHESYNHPDIICHRDAINAQGHAPIQAGDNIDIQWQGWPESHKGPLLTYLAFCGTEAGSCESIDKTQLEFFMIGEDGLIDPDNVPTDFATAEGTWASDEFIFNNSSWVTKIPESLSPGFYVLRQELIALHFSLDMEMGGSQHYPQCVNLEVLGTGTEIPPGVRGMDLYTFDEEVDPGLVFDISQSPLPEYEIPGPTLIEDAATSIHQTVPSVTSTADAVPGDEEEEGVLRMRVRGQEEVGVRGLRMGVRAMPTPEV